MKNEPKLKIFEPIGQWLRLVPMMKKMEAVKDASRLMCIPELAGFIQFYWRIFYHQFHRFSNEHIHGLNIITM